MTEPTQQTDSQPHETKLHPEQPSPSDSKRDHTKPDSLATEAHEESTIRPAPDAQPDSKGAVTAEKYHALKRKFSALREVSQ